MVPFSQKCKRPQSGEIQEVSGKRTGTEKPLRHPFFKTLQSGKFPGTETGRGNRLSKKTQSRKFWEDSGKVSGKRCEHCKSRFHPVLPCFPNTIWRCLFNFSPCLGTGLRWGKKSGIGVDGYDVPLIPHTPNTSPHPTNPTWGGGGGWGTWGWGDGVGLGGSGIRRISCTYAYIHTCGYQDYGRKKN